MKNLCIMFLMLCPIELYAGCIEVKDPYRIICDPIIIENNSEDTNIENTNTAGGGGCGSNSACGNNSIEIDLERAYFQIFGANTNIDIPSRLNNTNTRSNITPRNSRPNQLP